jgi:transcriptional regulator with GAF, ATPase, and Fis domain
MDLDFHTYVADAVREMSSRSSVGRTVERAVQMCIETVEHCDMAGASLISDGAIRTLAASDENLREIDELQYGLREGPCFDALRNEEVVTSFDLSNDVRWPSWGPQLSERTGMHSSMSFRLFTTKDSFGVLNMYSASISAFGHEEVLEGHVLAAMTAVSVAASIKEEQLQRALESRTVIGQATGMLMERFGINADAAFSVIRRMSQAHNIKIHTLASDMVETGSLPLDGTPLSRVHAPRARPGPAR